MGQFTNLFQGLETDEKKQPKVKNSKTAENITEKKTAAAPAAKELKTVKAKSAATKPKINEKAPDAPAPMRGKRSHPDYTQAPAFVRKDTYKAVKIALLNDERSIDYSDLVEELLTAWLKTKR